MSKHRIRVLYVVIIFVCLWMGYRFFVIFHVHPEPRSNCVGLTDVDKDGDLDAVVGNGPGNIDYSGEPNTIWLNDGSGNFTDSGQRLIGGWMNNWDVTHSVALGDLDGDGDTDVIFGNAVPSPNTTWLNDGKGRFDLHSEHSMKPEKSDNSFSNDVLGYTISKAIAIGDLDADGDLDVYVGNCCRSQWVIFGKNEFSAQGYANADNMVWLNDGSGRFTDSGQFLENSATEDVALGDLDGDGDLDVFEANRGSHSEFESSNPEDIVWFNDGNGHFTDSGQHLGSSDGYAIALGDLDGDGDLDAFIGNGNSVRADEVWLNDGKGYFTDSQQRLGDDNARIVVLDDVDLDGDLDTFVGNEDFGQIWINDGIGHFRDSGQRFKWNNAYVANLGDVDVDGDGNKDVFAIRFNGHYLIWHNDGTGRFSRARNWSVIMIPLALVLTGCLLAWSQHHKLNQLFLDHSA